jgi:hypothetical protein
MPANEWRASHEAEELTNTYALANWFLF